MTIVWWLRGLPLSVRLSNNLWIPAVGQIHKPSLVLNLGSIFVLWFDQIEYCMEAVAQCSCMLNLSVYTLFVIYLWGFIQFRKSLLWLEFRSWRTNCCLRYYDEGGFAINVEEAKQRICLEWLVVHSFFLELSLTSVWYCLVFIVGHRDPNMILSNISHISDSALCP